MGHRHYRDRALGPLYRHDYFPRARAFVIKIARCRASSHKQTGSFPRRASCRSARHLFVLVVPGAHPGAARTPPRPNAVALPVVDESGDILGIITVDDAMEILLPKYWRQRLPLC